MNQPYLDIARSYINGTAALPLAQEASASVDLKPGSEHEDPIPFAAYRNDGLVLRCSKCGHLLSAIAVGDLCGRCVGPQLQMAADDTWHPEAALRGKALAALDRRSYPRVTFPEGICTGPGLLSWAPVLREMNIEELRRLLDVVTRIPIRAKLQAEDHADAVP